MAVRGFFASLYDMDFKNLIAERVIRILYWLIVIVISITAVLALLRALFDDGLVGIVLTFILTPLLYLVELIFTRVVLEVLIVVFRMAEDVRAIRTGGGAPPQPAWATAGPAAPQWAPGTYGPTAPAYGPETYGPSAQAYGPGPVTREQTQTDTDQEPPSPDPSQTTAYDQPTEAIPQAPRAGDGDAAPHPAPQPGEGDPPFDEDDPPWIT
jgi:hypothetical protein